MNVGFTSKKDYDMSGMSSKDIQELIEQAEKELDCRRATRRKELVADFIKAAQALHDEFPYVELLLEVECDEGGDHEIDFFDEIFRSGKTCMLRYEDFRF